MPFDGKNFETPAKLSPAELMATPDHMLAWLRSRAPDEVVAASLASPTACLGCAFMRAHGHARVTFGGSMFGEAGEDLVLPAWFQASNVESAFARLYLAGHLLDITAAQAIKAVAGAASSPRRAA